MCKMKRTTPNVLFYVHRARLNRSGKAPIFRRIIVNGNRKDVHRKEVIEPKHYWRISNLIPLEVIVGVSSAGGFLVQAYQTKVYLEPYE